MNEVRALVEAFDAATRAGERCALATVISLEMPNSRSVSTAACITGASESEPIRISTEIWDISLSIDRVASGFSRKAAAGVQLPPQGGSHECRFFTALST